MALEDEAIRLSQQAREAIFADAQAAWPREACGLVGGKGNQGSLVFAGQNTSEHPETTFELDSDTLARQIELEEAGLRLVAIYHSHPAGPPHPSPTDIALAYYPDSATLICSLVDRNRPTLRAFFIRNGAVQEVPVSVGEEPETRPQLH